MERKEHSLVPEWLRCTGNAAGPHHSDVSSMHSPRNRTVGSNSEKSSSLFPDRNFISDSRHSSSSSNGSAKHPYSSFTRSHRNRNRVREKEKPFLDDIWNRGSLDPLESILTSGVDRNGFRRSQSLVSRKPGEVLTRTVEDSRKSSSNAVPSGGSNNPKVIRKSAFEKDFPSLITEEKQDMTGNSRLLSPSLSSAVQSLPVANSGFLGFERWTSALVEVPAILANNGEAQFPRQQNMVTSCAGGRNMAEALSQPPSRVDATPQLPDKSQRLEELAIKQSRRLIPMTPTMPKPLSLNSGDKSKQPKLAIKTNETSSKGVQPQPRSPHLHNHSRPGHVISDSSSNSSHTGKFLVLKPGRENSSISTGDDANCKVLNGQAANFPKNSVVSALKDKVTALSIKSKSNVESIRPSQSLAKSRSDFFNLMRRKNVANATTSRSDSSVVVSSPGAEIVKGGHDAPDSRSLSENGCQSICNGNGHYSPEKSEIFSEAGEKNLVCNGHVCPEEEEAAFLRSLGWEENGGEDEGLTEEEINAFYQEYMNRWPSLKVRISSQPKCSALPAISSSESSSLESEI